MQDTERNAAAFTADVRILCLLIVANAQEPVRKHALENPIMPRETFLVAL